MGGGIQKRKLPPVVEPRPAKLPLSRKHQVAPSFELSRKALTEDSSDPCFSDDGLY